jgi:hypothetical protein
MNKTGFSYVREKHCNGPGSVFLLPVCNWKTFCSTLGKQVNFCLNFGFTNIFPVYGGQESESDELADADTKQEKKLHK